jgi:hypothetical protein
MGPPSRPFSTLTPAKALTRAWLLLWLIGSAPAFASKASEAALGQIRPYQVWLDELPPTLAAGDVEIVVLQPDAHCKPAPVKVPGFPSVQRITPIDKAGCHRLQGFDERQPNPRPIPTRLHTAELTLAEWWQKRVGPTGSGRHAFLAEPPACGSPVPVPFFQP